MKKMLVILAVLLCLLLSACTASTSESQPNASNQGGELMGYRYPNQYSVAAYNQFLEEWNNSPENFLLWSKLPENFVHLNAIPKLGAFSSFVPSPSFPVFYRYAYKDNKGNDIYLEITHLSGTGNNISTDDYKLMSVTKDMTSMLNAPCTEPSVIVRNGVEYRYGYYGNCSSVIWCQNGIQFKLSGQFGSFEGAFASPTGCFDIYRLFSINEAEASAAFEEIKQALNSK